MKTMTQKPDIIIAIDPDVERSGVAVLVIKERRLKTFSMDFPSLLDYLRIISEQLGNPPLIVVEAGWLNASHWHLTARDTPRLAAAKGNAAGRNHETGRKIIEMAKFYGLKVEEAKPLRKCWHGRDGKITHEELASLLERKGIVGLPKTTNQDARDSALLAVVYSNL